MTESLVAQVASLEVAVTKLSRAVSDLGGVRFLEPLNGWSTRDIVAHLIGWNRYVIKGSQEIIRGELPFYDLDPGENYSKVNDVHIVQYPSEDPRELLWELHQSAEELKEYLLTLEPEVWAADFGVRHQDSIVTIENTVREQGGTCVTEADFDQVAQRFGMGGGGHG